MNEDKLLEISGVFKKFCYDRKKEIAYGLSDIVSDFFGCTSRERLRTSEFWSLEDINLSLGKGECLGVIGRNGVGKSTLLKVISGVVMPDRGSVSVVERIGAIIEVGSGFHPLLTGSENISLLGAINGLSSKEVRKIKPEVIKFSGLGEFIDSPIRQYSSGMCARLGFAIAAHTNPELLLVDEALAVGDALFQKQCLKKIDELISEGCGVIFVSHQLQLVEQISNRVLYLMPSGMEIGSPASMIDKYREEQLSPQDSGAIVNDARLRVTKVFINEEEAEVSLERGAEIRIIAEYDCNDSIECIISFAVHDYAGRQVMCVRSDGDDRLDVEFFKGKGEFGVVILENYFMPGIYYVSVRVYEKVGYVPIVNHHAAYPFLIEGGMDSDGVVRFPYKWLF